MNLANELYRKALHFLLILIPIFFCYLGKWKTLIIIAPIALIIISLDYMRRSNSKIQEIFLKMFRHILRPHEITTEKFCGASAVMLGACINFFFFKKEIAVISFVILVISDALSAIVGKAIPSKPFFEKTCAGTLAFFTSALAILIILGLNFHVSFWFYFFGIFSVACVTMVEARPSLLDIDDNLTIPLTFSCLMTGFAFMWGF
ncbi:MAG: hypothetical protein KGP29_05780 [Proteobacteria bacterium]|nr:hypothetical protein [Pseudomonadota bacterium]